MIHPIRKLVGWRRRLVASVRNWWETPTEPTMKGRRLMARSAVVVGFLGAYGSTIAYNRAQDRDQARATAQLVYVGRHGDWVRDNDDYEACRDGIPASVLIRSYLDRAATLWEESAANEDDPDKARIALEQAAAIRPFLATAPRTEDDCTDPGPEPMPPD